MGPRGGSESYQHDDGEGQNTTDNGVGEEDYEALIRDREGMAETDSDTEESESPVNLKPSRAVGRERMKFVPGGGGMESELLSQQRNERQAEWVIPTLDLVVLLRPVLYCKSY